MTACDRISFVNPHRRCDRKAESNGRCTKHNEPMHQDKPQHNELATASKTDTTPDWTKTCEVCGETPIVPLTGMCGPCTFGEADTAGGNW